MKIRTSTRVPRTATLVAAAALAVGLLPAMATNAVAAPEDFPSLGYLTYGGGNNTSTTDKLWATDGTTFDAGTLLTPNTYAYAYDVSDDGDTLVVAGQARALTVPDLNTTYGMLLVERDDADVVTTTSIATVFDSNPVVSPDGAFVYWIDSGKIWKYDVAAKGNATAVSTLFAPAAGEGIGRLAISPTGTAAAVIFTTTSGGVLTKSRIKVGRLDGVGTEFSYTGTVSTGLSYAVGTSLVFTSDTQVAFNVFRSGGLSGTWSTSGIGATPSTDKSPGIGAVYDLGTDGANWYSFQDVPGEGTKAGKSAAPYTPAAFEPFPLGTGTTRYVPAVTTPPVAAATVGSVANRAAATSYLFLAKSAVPTGTRVMFASLAAYLTDSTGTRGADVKAQSRYGQLKSSIDGGSNFTTTTTTGAGSSLLTWPTGAPFGNGYTAGLTRNTWLQWCFQGDAFVTADCTTTKKITVNPTVSVGVQKLNSTKRVYGKVARTGGTAVLSRYVSGKWVAITSATVSSTGTFSFGFRSLAAGSYKVTTKADTYWGSGLKQLSL